MGDLCNRYYDVLSDDFNTISKRRSLYLNSINKLITDFVNYERFKKVLDIGSAEGNRILEIKKNLINPINIDCIEPSIKLFKKLKINLDKNKNFNFFNSDLENFDQSVKKYDAIFALWNVIGHIENIDQFFNKSKNLLKDQGYLVLDLNNSLNIKQYGITNFLKNIIKIFFRNIISQTYPLKYKNVETRVRIISPFEIKKIFKNYGFKIIKSSFIDYDSGKKANIFSGQLFIIAKIIH